MSRAETPPRPSPHGELASPNHVPASLRELASIPPRDARRRRLGLAGSGVSPRVKPRGSPRARCAAPVRAPQVPARVSSSPFDPPAPKSHPAANWLPPPRSLPRRPPPSGGPNARPPDPPRAGWRAPYPPPTRESAARAGESQTPNETSRHGRTAAGPPALAPRRHARAPHARRSPSDPPPQRPSPRPVDWPGSPLHILSDQGWADGCHAIVPAREMCCQGQG